MRQELLRRLQRLEGVRQLPHVHMVGPVEADEDADALVAEAIASGRARPGGLVFVRHVVDPDPDAFDWMDEDD